VKLTGKIKKGMLSSQMITSHDNTSLLQLIILAPDDNHMGLNVIIYTEILSSGANVIIWDEMLLSRMKSYHLG
jgi:hypothetical protein